jgi:hypothetical protein
MAMANYIFDTNPKAREDIEKIISMLADQLPIRIGDLPILIGLSFEKVWIATMWLAKFDLIKLYPPKN